MRILHIITLSELGGAQSVVSNLAKAQSVENEVFIISGGEGTAWKSLNPRVKVYLIRELERSITLLDIIVLRKISKLKRLIRPDVVHLHSSKMGAFGRILFDKNKIIYTVHGFDSILVANKKFLFIEKLLKNRAHKIIGVSNYDKHNLNNVGISSNVECVYNGIEDITIRTDMTLSTEEKNKIDVLKEKYTNIVCCIARDDQQKKIDLFFDIATRFPQFAFVWIGNTNSYNNLSENIYLFGKISEASRFLKFVDMFILPSNYEGLPMSIIEALSFGLPVVASNVGGISELLDGTNGMIAENTTDDFSAKIEQILLNHDLYKSISRNARLTFENKFTLEVMANNYQNVINEIITVAK